ncbi:MAG: ABC transporter ATP-binding protein [Chloracidobacterium sp. CP2_5A]|nr:MAG: ABC transporter ATP-binding protein [Chloracidobacterium sp. CP2_5A]
MGKPALAVTTAPPAVSLQHVNKSFGMGNTYLSVLKDISLEVRRGELLLLVGPSGCGKTTLLSVMAGILDVDDGVVDVFGTRMDKLSQSGKTRFRQESVGFIFQQFNLIPTLTATENVAVPLIIAGRPYRAALERARHYLSLVGLGDCLERFPTQLSGGQQQRVAIARALVSEPRLVVCDEPTASLDGATGQLIMEIFRNVALSAERAIVVVTHDNRIFPYGDRLAEMLDGRIVGIHDNPDHVK